MKINKPCDRVKDLIEKQLLNDEQDYREEISRHTARCPDCMEFYTALTAAKDVSNLKYTMPYPADINFSAAVRAEIESRKVDRRRGSVFLKPAFQVALLFVVFAVVLWYFFGTIEPSDRLALDRIETTDQLFVYNGMYDPVFYDDDLLADNLYSEYIVPEITEDFLLQQTVTLFYDYFLDLDDLTDDEINELIARLQNVL